MKRYFGVAIFLLNLSGVAKGSYDEDWWLAALGAAGVCIMAHTMATTSR